MTYWKSQSFKELQRAWYQRLSEEGFQDAEELVGEDMVLRQQAAHPLRNELERQSGKEEYYRLIAQKVAEAFWDDEVDRRILTLHAEGLKAVEIVRVLKSEGTSRFRHAVRFTVRRYEVRWGLREWTPTELGKKRPTSSSQSMVPLFTESGETTSSASGSGLSGTKTTSSS